LAPSRTALHGWLISIDVWGEKVKALTLAFAILRAFYQLAVLVVYVGLKLTLSNQLVNPCFRTPNRRAAPFVLNTCITVLQALTGEEVRLI